MNNRTTGWVVLLFSLFLSSFGIFWCITTLFGVLAFCIGLISLLYVLRGNAESFYVRCAGNPLTIQDLEDGGLKRIISLLQNPQGLPKTDRRVTGSELIDSSLQEILSYVIRDYISPWYNLISLDGEFSELAVKRTSQTLAINISNRVKDIDWIPYLTTRLVDDAASHLRLYKQARKKLEQNNRLQQQRNSPSKDHRSSPKRSVHKRNKSEADASMYTKSKSGDTECNVGNSKFYMTEGSKNTLEDYFFELECQMENDITCRELVCTNIDREKEFLSELVELLFYVLLPDEDFQCKSVRFIMREIFSTCVVLPLFTMISNPDFINQTIIWLCASENYLASDVFLSTLRLTNNCDELKHTKGLISKEIQLLRSRDSGGDSDMCVKQQLSSLFYVSKLIDNRLLTLEHVEQSDGNDYAKLESVTAKIKLPLDVILKNNLALSYFIDYATNKGLQAYLFFYLNIKGWKASVEQQLSEKNPATISLIYESIRTTALSIYEQYLGEKAQHKVQIKPSLVYTLFHKIRNLADVPSEHWFDEIELALYETLRTQPEFLPQFYHNRTYLKLLEELDLIQQNVIEEDAISLCILENNETNLEDKSKDVVTETLQSSGSQSAGIIVTNPKEGQFLSANSYNKATKHVRSFSDITELTGKYDSAKIEENNSGNNVENLKTDSYSLSIEIIETGIVCEKGKTFGVYAIHVTRQYDTGFVEEWHIYRRYSDFYDLHTKIKERYPNMAKLPFPGKKTFHNMERSVLERRMRMLGYYLQHVCQPHVLSSHLALRDLLMTFLEQGDYDRATSGGPISHTIDTIVNPLKSGMKTIKNMPEQFINTVDEVVEGLSKVFHGKSYQISEASKVGASLDIESDDNIPLRIMLLLMDEVFDLKSRNQWLRRRIVTLLRQIVRTMFGDIVNRRILDYVSYITSPKNVARYLHNFKHSFWPNGIKAERNGDRDEATCYRTRIAAKVALLSWLSDELKHIIGSETTRRGLLTIFELFQRPVLNRRLLYVLMEGALTSLFPEKNIPDIFRKLHLKYRHSKGKSVDHSMPDTSKVR